MNHLYVDIHVLQSVPPSNINRDDTGAPKTAVYGGVRRARISSQAQKRATREAFKDLLDTSELGVRSVRLVEILAEGIEKLLPESTLDERVSAATEALKAVGIKISKSKKEQEFEQSGYLVFISQQQIDALAKVAAESVTTGEKIDTKEARTLIKGKNSVDLALFGRMIADVADLNVDASAQVAHAISTHGVDNEFDYFTAVDDHKRADTEEDAGAGMIGTVEFNSSTLYRYATVNVEQLQHNLGDTAATVRAIAAFVRTFTTSMPTGKQNTFANRTLPDGVVVTLRTDQPVNWVGAFESPIISDSGRVAGSAAALRAYAGELDEAYGEHRAATWVVAVGEKAAPLKDLGDAHNFDSLVAAVDTELTRRLVEVL